MTDIPERLQRLECHIKNSLACNLPETLAFHGYRRTFEDVIPAVHRICEGEGVAGPERELLVAAAMFLDVGYAESNKDTEWISARIAARTLQEFGFGSTEISRVLELVLSTEVREVDGCWRQIPGDDLACRILCDATRDEWGRTDCFAAWNRLRRELENHGQKYSDQGWLALRISSLSPHRWFTETQRSHRESTKLANLDLLRRLMAGESGAQRKFQIHGPHAWRLPGWKLERHPWRRNPSDPDPHSCGKVRCPWSKEAVGMGSKVSDRPQSWSIQQATSEYGTTWGVQV